MLDSHYRALALINADFVLTRNAFYAIVFVPALD
jgi:hypothetical protein